MGKVFYNVDVRVDVVSEEVKGDQVHVIFDLIFANDYFENQMAESQVLRRSSGGGGNNANNGDDSETLPIKSEIFFDLFPFHIVFKPNMEVISVGDSLGQVISNIEGELFSDTFNLSRPMVAFTWDNVHISLN